MRLSAAGPEAASILGEVADALSGAERIEIGARVGGTVDDPELNLRSSLEGLLEPMVRRRLEQAAGDFRDELTAAVRDRTREPMTELARQIEHIETLEAEVRERLSAYEDLREQLRERLD
jgi:flagellar motility protein MotE (MotC chaperone)